MADIDQDTAHTLAALACKNFAAMIGQFQLQNTGHLTRFDPALRGSLSAKLHEKSQCVPYDIDDLFAALTQAHKLQSENRNAIEQLLLVSIALLPTEFTAPQAA